MELKTAIEILEYHQEWRLGKRDDMIHEPKKLTEALDIVLEQVKKLNQERILREMGTFHCHEDTGNNDSCKSQCDDCSKMTKV